METILFLLEYSTRIIDFCTIEVEIKQFSTKPKDFKKYVIFQKY